jgi:hypothetical protein
MANGAYKINFSFSAPLRTMAIADKINCKAMNKSSGAIISIHVPFIIVIIANAVTIISRNGGMKNINNVIGYANF